MPEMPVYFFLPGATVPTLGFRGQTASSLIWADAGTNQQYALAIMVMLADLGGVTCGADTPIDVLAADGVTRQHMKISTVDYSPDGVSAMWQMKACE